MDKEKINYFIYVRKSTEGKDRQALSHEGQLIEIEKIVEREQLTVKDVFKESKSAHIPDNRPLFDQMLKRIKRGEANGIIAWHTNRLSRNPKEAGIIQQLLQDEVIKSIIVPYRHFKSEDNALLFSIEASEANQYSRDLKVSVKRGLYQKCAMGQPPITAPPGYSNTKHSESGSNSIIIDPKRGPLMRKAFDLMLTRQYTVREITNILNNNFNFRTRSSKMRLGSPISVSMLHRAFTNPFYTGYFNYGGTQYKGAYKPLITLEEFDKIQGILGRKGKSKPHKHEFAFTGFIKCGSCGCAVTASKKLKKIKTTGEYRTYTFYHCTKRKGSTICADKKYTTEKEMAQMIQDELAKVTLMPQWKEWALGTCNEAWDEELAKQQDLLKATHDYKFKLMNELDTLLDLRISNQLSDEQYTQKKADREAQVIRVKEKYFKIEKNVNNWIALVKEKLDFAELIVERFKNGGEKLKKRICDYIGWNWTLQGKKLTFTKHDWFIDLVFLSEHYTQQKEQLEPIKTFIEYKETSSFTSVCPMLSSLRDHIRTDKREYS